MDSLEKILDHTPFLLNRCSRDLRYRYVSKACAAMLGRTTDEIVGKPIIDIIGPKAFETIRPYVETVLRGQRIEYEAEVPYASVGPRQVHVIYVPERDEQSQVVGWIASIADITERKLAEASARESEGRFRTMANHAPVLLWMAGRDKLCTFFNQGWLEFTGRSLEQESGNGWVEGVHPDDLQHCVETYHSAFDARQPFKMEYRLRRHDGEYRWILNAGAPRFAPDGEFMGYVGSCVDISDQKKAEESNRRLEHLQRLAAMGEMTAVIAHEVRQPLTAIITNVDVASRLLDATNERLGELREIISDIRADDSRGIEVLKRVRDFTHKREARMTALDLNSAVVDTLHFIAGDAQSRRIQVRTELASGLPMVLGDWTQLQQVLINLVINGMDAMADTPKPERYLTIRTRPHGNDQVEIAVTDHGGGIAPGDMLRLFESFFTTKEEGMGLGLSVARSIVETHRGRIWAENNPRGGATFHFTVPVAQT